MPVLNLFLARSSISLLREMMPVRFFAGSKKVPLFQIRDKVRTLRLTHFYLSIERLI